MQIHLHPVYDTSTEHGWVVVGEEFALPFVRPATTGSRHTRKSTRRWAKKLRRDPCVWCGEPSDTIDHIDPLRVGGSSSPDNLVGCCYACNYRRRDHPLLHWMLERASMDETGWASYWWRDEPTSGIAA